MWTWLSLFWVLCIFFQFITYWQTEVESPEKIDDATTELERLADGSLWPVFLVIVLCVVFAPIIVLLSLLETIKEKRK